jgi:hypothetical protein
MLISYILSGSITVLSQRSTAASRDARSGRPGLAPRPADPAVNVPGFPRFAAARADLRWGASQAHPRVPGEHRRRRYRAGRWAGSGQEAPDRFLGAIIVPVWRPASGCTRHPRRRGSVRRVGFRERRGLGRGRRHAGSPAGITPNARRALTRSARLASCECQLNGLESGRSVLCRV